MSDVGQIKNFISTEAKNFFQLRQSKRIWHIPLLASLAVGIPAFVGWYFGNLSMGLSASLGGLVILYYQPAMPLAKRMLIMLGCSFGFLLSFSIGFGFHPYISAVVFGLFAMGVHWITAYCNTRPPGSFFFIMIAAMASCQNFAWETMLQKIGLMSLGTMLACLLALGYGLVTIQKKHAVGPLSATIKPREFVSLVESGIIGIVMFASMAVGHLLDMKNPYWIPISCLAVMQGMSRYHVWERVFHRIVGTFVGLGLCWGLLLVCKTPLSICICIFLLQFIIEILIVKHYAAAVIFITPMTILLAEAGSSLAGNSDLLMATRFLDTTLGSLIGAVGGWLIYHQQLKQKVVRQLRKTRVRLRKKN